jgi:hypothetical protein
MIPAEVIGLYLVGTGFIPAEQPVVLAVWAGVCLLGVLAIRVYGTSDSAANEPFQVGAVVISAIAFVIWIYTIGGPFVAFDLHIPYVASLLVLSWTFFVPIFYRGAP